MDLSVGEVSRIFRAYQSQSKIAELNRKENIKTVQTQVDRVSISPEARRLLSVTDAAESKPDVARFTNLDDMPSNPEAVNANSSESAENNAETGEEKSKD